MYSNGTTPGREISPSQAAYVYSKLILDLQKVREWNQKHIEGCMLDDPTTPSTQAAGIGNTAWRVNMGAGIKVVDGTPVSQALTADIVVHSGSLLAGFVLGNSAIASIVAYGATGTILSVIGTPALIGAAAAPTKAAIQTAVDVAAAVADTAWTAIGETRLDRTLDTTVVQTLDNTKRPLLSINQDSDMGDWSYYAA